MTIKTFVSLIAITAAFGAAFGAAAAPSSQAATAPTGSDAPASQRDDRTFSYNDFRAAIDRAPRPTPTQERDLGAKCEKLWPGQSPWICLVNTPWGSYEYLCDEQTKTCVKD